jgi:hypothetical protein
MKYIGILAIVTKLALGDFCWQLGSDFAMNFRQQGTRLQVTTRGNYPWVGFGIPKNPTFTKMNLGNYVVGGGGRVFDMILTVDRNIGPNMAGTMDYVPGTESTSTVGGVTTLSFERELAPGNGYLSIDATRPFNIMWATGPLTSGSGWQSIGYHMRQRGTFRVDMSSRGNCDGATSAALSAASPTFTSLIPKGKKGGTPKTPKKAPPKKVCTLGQTLCTSALQAQGLNCIVNTCVTTTTAVPATTTSPVCTAAQTFCTTAMASQYSCILGSCFYIPRSPSTATTVCPNGQTLCTVGLQAQGANCIVGACFGSPLAPPSSLPVCVIGQTLCTSALQASGVNCVLNQCVEFRGR